MKKLIQRLGALTEGTGVRPFDTRQFEYAWNEMLKTMQQLPPQKQQVATKAMNKFLKDFEEFEGALADAVTEIERLKRKNQPT